MVISEVSGIFANGVSYWGGSGMTMNGENAVDEDVSFLLHPAVNNKKEVRVSNMVKREGLIFMLQK
jgi:hypothetical protein